MPPDGAHGLQLQYTPHTSHRDPIPSYTSLFLIFFLGGGEILNASFPPLTNTEYTQKNNVVNNVCHIILFHYLMETVS